MRFAINVPNFGDLADVRHTAELAAAAEEAGWDGFFVWDHVHATFGPVSPMADPWVLLTAVALATDRMRIGTMVTPVPRRRPWTLARETVTVDRLSGGRLVLGVGIGFPPDLEFAAFGEDPDARERGRKLDEGLEVLTALWSGEPVTFAGDHYSLSDVRFLPTPVQRPRVPIWVAQMYPHRAPLRRAAHWDGLVPMHETDVFPTPAKIDEVVSDVRSRRNSADPFDVNVPIVVPDDRSAARRLVRDHETAGATWLQIGATTPAELGALVATGPPTA